jgi:hypothetical protein
MGLQEKKRLKRIKEYVINRDGMICCYCDMPLTLDKITLEHIVPDSKRGTFNSTNLTVACGPCNNTRGNKPFFDYCKKFNFGPEKIDKYKTLYFNNLRIKVLNIAKENCIKQNFVIPIDIINQACKILKIKSMDFSVFEKEYSFEIKFNEVSDRKKIKWTFEQLIRIIEIDC